VEKVPQKRLKTFSQARQFHRHRNSIRVDPCETRPCLPIHGGNFDGYHEMIVQMIVPWRHRADKSAGAV